MPNTFNVTMSFPFQVVYRRLLATKSSATAIVLDHPPQDGFASGVTSLREDWERFGER